MPYISPADYQRQADQRYWQDVVRFRWIAVASFFVLTAVGILPFRMPWWPVAASALVATNVAYTLYRRRTSRYTRYQDVAGVLDIVTISLTLIAVGTIDHPLWVAYVLVIPAVANFKRHLYNAGFAALTLGCFALVYVVTDVYGGAGRPLREAVVTSIMLLLVTFNETIISANNFRLREVIRRQAMTDPLTQLPNRRRLFEALESYQPGETKLAVMMMDLDDFKLLNESLGHLTADRILAQVGQVLAGVPSGSALPARYGGDEFALLLEVDHCDEAEALAQRLIGEALERAGIGLTVGIAACPCDAPTPVQALYLADNNLRRAKDAGKQRVIRAA